MTIIFPSSLADFVGIINYIRTNYIVLFYYDDGIEIERVEDVEANVTSG
jgi:hypothetical protein